MHANSAYICYLQCKKAHQALLEAHTYIVQIPQASVSPPGSSPHICYRSRVSTPGRSTNGGLGADGRSAGGGGGGGFYGGGGGGSGQQGGGGGGGSSYADIRELKAASGSAVGNVGDVRLVKAGDTWVEVEWDAVVDAAPGEELVWYEVSLLRFPWYQRLDV